MPGLSHCPVLVTLPRACHAVPRLSHCPTLRQIAAVRAQLNAEKAEGILEQIADGDGDEVTRRAAVCLLLKCTANEYC